MDKLKGLFQGKKKYITIGAILLVVLLAFLSARNKQSSGGNPRLAGTTADSSKIATGAGNPGLTTADIQNAIDSYDKKQTEKYDAMTKANMDALEKLSSGFSDSLNKVIASNNDQIASINDRFGKQFESLTDHLTKVENQNKEWAAGLQNSFTNSLQDMMRRYDELQQSMRYNAQPYYAGGYGGGSSYSSGSSGGSAVVDHWTTQDGFDHYNTTDTRTGQVIESKTPTTDRLKDAVDAGSSQGSKYLDYLNSLKH